MKYLSYLLASAFALTTSAVSADYACDPCDPCYTVPSNACVVDECCGFEAYVDALYWHVCSGDVDRDVGSQIETLDPDYEWGWRLGGIYHNNSWNLGFRYTWFSSKTEENFYPVGLGPQEFQTIYDFKYRVFDLELSKDCCLCSGMVFRPFVGGKFAQITVDTYGLNTQDALINMNYEGRGLYLGFENRWEFCNFTSCGCNIPLALITRLSTGVMYSDFNQSGDLDSVDRLKDCQFIPQHEVYVGLELGFDGVICDTDGFLQMGYESQYWGWRDYNSDEDITHLGLGGLVLRFGLAF